ncbi:hypoxanthine-guanine-xanthine phosphoribosyltransferase [Plasmodium fragile]|uniref:Hypoxanthine phosphoribosyltransferase n=1 Tax=Plasmodium fragile TaxID=5857 RepID=A0A0D9QG89_PLAFR|nr:hypoxanthine-guanine-xanthine phosphoribosyltransferase [Plasmodium fragile]KJP86034.1 hypoxanthine-guanine-xanthine phosphoribosyltransferase [Plasmodium fragile]
MKIPNNPGAGENALEPIYVKDDDGYDMDTFLIPDHYKNYMTKVLIPNGILRNRIEKLAFDIKRVYRNEEFHIICLLKGSRGFFTALLKYLNRIHNYSSTESAKHLYVEHYVRVKSYCNDKSLDRIEIVSEDLSCLKDKHVLIVEDIIDTGKTLSKFCEYLKKFEVKTIAITCLFIKRTPLWNGFKADFVGFSIPDAFVVGYSLDYNEKFRDLEHLCVVNEEGINKFRASPPSS